MNAETEYRPHKILLTKHSRSKSFVEKERKRNSKPAFRFNAVRHFHCNPAQASLTPAVVFLLLNGAAAVHRPPRSFLKCRPSPAAMLFSVGKHSAVSFKYHLQAAASIPPVNPVSSQVFCMENLQQAAPPFRLSNTVLRRPQFPVSRKMRRRLQPKPRRLRVGIQTFRFAETDGG